MCGRPLPSPARSRFRDRMTPGGVRPTLAQGEPTSAPHLESKGPVGTRRRRTIRQMDEMRIAAAVRGTEPPAWNAGLGQSAQGRVGLALASRSPGTHPDLTDPGGEPKTIDVPVQCLGLAQVPGQARQQVPLRRACIDIPPRREPAVRTSGHHDPARARDPQDEAINPGAPWAGPTGAATCAARRCPLPGGHSPAGSVAHRTSFHPRLGRT